MGRKNSARNILMVCVVTFASLFAAVSSAGVVNDFEEFMRLYSVDEFIPAAKILTDISGRVTGKQAQELRALVGNAYLARLTERDDFKDAAMAIVEKAAAADMRRRNDSAYMTALAKGLISEEYEQRKTAQKELKYYGAHSAPYIFSLFKGNITEKQRVDIIIALELLGRRMTFPLIAALESKDVKVVESALLALQKVFDPVSAPAVLRFSILTKDPAYRQGAMKLVNGLAQRYGVPVESDVHTFNWIARAFLENSSNLEVDPTAKQLPLWSWSEKSKTVEAQMVPRALYSIRMGLIYVKYGLELQPGDRKLMTTAANLLIQHCIVGGEGASGARLNLYTLGPDVLLAVIDESLGKGKEPRLQKALEILKGFGPIDTVDGPSVYARGEGIMMKVIWRGNERARLAAFQSMLSLGMINGLKPLGKKLFSEAFAGVLYKCAGVRRVILVASSQDFGKGIGEDLATGGITLDVATSEKQFRKLLGKVPGPEAILVYTEIGRKRGRMYKLAQETGYRAIYIGPGEKRKQMDIDDEGPFEFITLPTTPEYMASFILGKGKPRLSTENLAMMVGFLGQLPEKAISNNRRQIAGVLDEVLIKTEGELRVAVIAQLARLGDLRSYTKLIRLAATVEADGVTRMVALRAIGLISRRLGEKPDSAVIDRIIKLTDGKSKIAEQARRTLGLIPFDENETWQAFVKVNK